MASGISFHTPGSRTHPLQWHGRLCVAEAVDASRSPRVWGSGEEAEEEEEDDEPVQLA